LRMARTILPPRAVTEITRPRRVKAPPVRRPSSEVLSLESKRSPPWGLAEVALRPLHRPAAPDGSPSPALCGAGEEQATQLRSSTVAQTTGEVDRRAAGATR